MTVAAVCAVFGGGFALAGCASHNGTGKTGERTVTVTNYVRPLPPGTEKGDTQTETLTILETGSLGVTFK